MLRILCIEDKDGIIGIAPLRKSRYRLAGPFGYDVIEPLAYRGLNPEGADYTGLILTKRAAECLRRFLDYLVKHDSWDFIYLMDIPETSAIPNLLSQMSNELPLRFKAEEGRKCPYAPLPNSTEILMKTFGPRFRKHLRQCARKLQSDFHKVEFKRYDEMGSVEETMRFFFELHQKRCKSKGLPGVFANREIRDFYVDLARLFANKGWLALYFLTVNDEPIAAQYSFEYANKMFFALGGFDPRYARYSIGNLLCLRIMEKCIERRLVEFDFLKGDESYKFYWTAEYRTNMEFRFVNQKVTSNIYDQGIRAMKRVGIGRMLGRFSAVSYA
jgi:CelD/BcsL family acetyltransferase involved in cellulose biosynthesis